MAKSYGVSSHPNREEMKALWLNGLRAAEILDWLEARVLPPVKKKTLESYGRRYWTPLLGGETITLSDDYVDEDTGTTYRVAELPVGSLSDEEDDIKAAEDILAKVAASGLGQVKSVKIGSKTYPTWKREEGDEVAVSEMGSSRMRTVEVIPSLNFGIERVQRTEVTLDYRLEGAALGKPEGWKLGVFLPDMQIGYFDNGKQLITTHDEAAIDVAHQMMAQAQEWYGLDYVVNAGDNLDLPAFGSHRSAPGYMTTTQNALTRASEEAAIQRALAPDAEISWIEGNHEQRLTNFLIDKAPQVLGIRRVGEDDPVMAVPYLCRFEDYGVNWVGPYPDGEIWINDHLRFEHGRMYGSAAGSTAPKYLKDGVSVGFGHIHRSEMVQETRHTPRGPRTHFAGSPGCLCLPVDNTEILTRRGWLGASEVKIGDETLGYDDGVLQWTEVTGKVLYEEPQELVKVTSQRFDVECTPDHRWLTRRVQTHETSIKHLMDMAPSDQFLLAAPSAVQSEVNLSIEEASLIGWILSDGSIEWNPGQCYRATITQSEKKYASEIRMLLDGMGITYAESTSITKENSWGIMGDECATFRIGRDFHSLWNRLGWAGRPSTEQLTELAMAMDASQREAVLLSFWCGDGVTTEKQIARGEFTIAQKFGEVQDFVSLLIFLGGRYPTSNPSSQHPHIAISRATSPVVNSHSYKSTKLEPTDSKPVWCVETGLGTWVARQSGQVFVTGNCRLDSKVPSAKTGIDASGEQSGKRVENWQNGIWFFWYETEGRQFVRIDDVSIWGGWSLWQGREFHATVDPNGDPL